MPWKLIFSLTGVSLLLVFVGINLGYTCTVSLGFLTLEKIPVYFVILVSFFLGLLVAFAINLARGNQSFQNNLPSSKSDSFHDNTQTTPKSPN